MAGLVMKSSAAMAGAMVLASAFPGVAQAQGQIAPTREEIDRRTIEDQLRQRPSPVSVEGDIERAPCPLAAPQFADLTFTFAAPEFTGLGPIDPALLAASYSDYIGQEIPLARICDIRDRAATILRSEGYLAAVQVPVQTIGEGKVKFDVLLARMKGVQVRGDAGASSGALRPVLDKLAAQDVFNSKDAERYLLLARDIPGLDVRLTLQPLAKEQGGNPGDVVGVFDVVHTPLLIDVNVQNFGSREIGRFGGLARVRLNGLTGLGDETMISGYATHDFSEQLVLSGHHEFKVGSEGLTFGLSGTRAWSTPEIPGGPNVFDTDTFVASLYARYPIIRSQQRNLSLSAGGDLIDQSVDFTDLDFSEDKLRVAFARLDFSKVDEDSINGRGGYTVFEPKIAYQASLEVRQGLDAFGASPSCGVNFAVCTAPGAVPLSRLDADPSAFVLRGDSFFTYRPAPTFGFTLRNRFQHSSARLLGYEQYSGGNFTVGRGYDPGAIIGDKGYGFQFEAFAGSLIPESPDGVAVQPFAFVDYARVELNDAADTSDSLTSLGGGMRMVIGRQALFDLFAAVPLERTNLQTSKGDLRILGTLTVQLQPWFN
ncbi:ShlB/FhaC/HecB family hemolysin secretion/activation protein [Erythrobacter sp. SCSIO 43205]|uniref:ShlB/FhaC/HecB family hemolysin secretion/activation protein n=1 Tax=Erythrobacter sp. SCSIO 43205 TaxID=2779361 RepID=UPI001CA8D456|nr:ShlB/FhaC/HecB family hemolysin secretion/activation protein [Erythrobacter sp. SCSIO 43205]UAB77665.1 ShlB/FhaC/HecB family hemolysin secretion/activation protein [Erythrobacter sp. SCSIO 43205]